ncbi:MAG TPA: DsrE family protein [Thermoleophilia bacterium]|nr:DsrE family protein [Thermoleophilia bacterium]
MASLLFVLNEGPYGSERSYNALRHAMAVAKQPDTQVRVFLMADATTCALAGQNTPEGYYSVERMLKGLVTKKAQVAL